MYEKLERLKAEHAALNETITSLLPRIGRRPVCRLAIDATLAFLDLRVSHHELDEEQLFAGSGMDPDAANALADAHQQVNDIRTRLRLGLSDWPEGAPAPDEAEDMACLAEEALYFLQHHFGQEERLFKRQIFRTTRPPQTGRAIETTA
ncbi:MAG: hemerythrin domain-containing protein [Leptospirillia bacterium]